MIKGLKIGEVIVAVIAIAIYLSSIKTEWNVTPYILIAIACMFLLSGIRYFLEGSKMVALIALSMPVLIVATVLYIL